MVRISIPRISRASSIRTSASPIRWLPSTKAAWWRSCISIPTLSKFDGWKEDFENWKENLKKEVVDYVNSKVNRFSRISEVVEEKQEFVKTPTQKIRRFLYTKRNPHQKHEMSKR